MTKRMNILSMIIRLRFDGWQEGSSKHPAFPLFTVLEGPHHVRSTFGVEGLKNIGFPIPQIFPSQFEWKTKKERKEYDYSY